LSVALGVGAIGVLALVLSAADGPLRFELQSAGIASKRAQPSAAQEDIERLRGELDALKNDVKELTEAQRQAAHTIATVKAAEEDLRRIFRPPIGTRTRRRWTWPSQANRNGPPSRSSELIQDRQGRLENRWLNRRSCRVRMPWHRQPDRP
jgi:hypothetical protein